MSMSDENIPPLRLTESQGTFQKSAIASKSRQSCPAQLSSYSFGSRSTAVLNDVSNLSTNSLVESRKSSEKKSQSLLSKSMQSFEFHSHTPINKEGFNLETQSSSYRQNCKSEMQRPSSLPQQNFTPLKRLSQKVEEDQQSSIATIIKRYDRFSESGNPLEQNFKKYTNDNQKDPKNRTRLFVFGLIALLISVVIVAIQSDQKSVLVDRIFTQNSIEASSSSSNSSIADRNQYYESQIQSEDNTSQQVKQSSELQISDVIDDQDQGNIPVQEAAIDQSQQILSLPSNIEPVLLEDSLLSLPPSTSSTIKTDQQGQKYVTLIETEADQFYSTLVKVVQVKVHESL